MAEEKETDLWAKNEYHFYGQRSDEQVMMVRNQHPVVLLGPLLIAAVTLVIPYATYRWLQGPTGFAILVIYWSLFIIFLAYHGYGYRSSVSILSDQRILNVNQKGFFNRDITEAELNRIQDVSTSIQGVLQTMFNYGHVTIRTASKDSVLILRNIGDAYDVQQSIVRALKKIKKED